VRRWQIARSAGFIVGSALALALLPHLGLSYRQVQAERVQALAASGALGSPFENYLGFYTYRFLPVGEVITRSGTPGEPGAADSSAEQEASFNFPTDVAVSATGVVLIADKENHTIREAGTTSWRVRTVAGLAGAPGSLDGVGAEASFNQPTGVAINSAGLAGLVADSSNHLIRHIDLITREVTTIAGSPGQPGYADGVGGEARFNNPFGVALSADSTIVLVADTDNHVIRRIDLTTRAVTTIAGSPGQPGSVDGVGAAARFNQPARVAIARGNAFALVADFATRAIRRIDLLTGAVTTVATLDDPPPGPALANGLVGALAVTLSCDDRYAIFSDGQQHIVGEIWLANATRRVIAGSTGEAGFRDGVGPAARFDGPTGITTNCEGNRVFVSDGTNHVLRTVIISPDYKRFLPYVYFSLTGQTEPDTR
jgi:sugar lactone lactonase YvrE